MVRRGLSAIVTALCLALTACGTPDAAVTVAPPDGALRVAAIGDSITDADSVDLIGGDIGEQSWLSYATGPDLAFVGGWARWGATTAEMVAATPDPLDADVLVILAGTNDATSTPYDEIGANLRELTTRAGIGSVVLASVPPLDRSPEAAQELNTYLQTLADAEGWTWVDASAGLREGRLFAPGMSYDGIHPTAEGARVIGEAIRAAVLEAR